MYVLDEFVVACRHMNPYGEVHMFRMSLWAEHLRHWEEIFRCRTLPIPICMLLFFDKTIYAPLILKVRHIMFFYQPFPGVFHGEKKVEISMKNP